MKSRIVSITLVICMLAMLSLSACSCAKSEQNTSTSASSVAKTTTAAPEADKWSLPYKGPEVHISLLGWESFKAIDPNTKFGQWFQEKLGNLKIDFEIPAEGTATKEDLYLASGDMPDILNLHRDPALFMKNYGDGSRTVNLFDYAKYMPEYTKRIALYPHLTSYAVENKTKNYLFFPTWYDTTSELWYQNQDLMDKYKLKTPTNYEEMVKCIETVRKAEPKVTGTLFHGWGLDYTVMCYAQLFGAKGVGPVQTTYDYTKKAWVFPLIEYKNIFYNTIKSMAEAYAKGSIHPDFLTWSGDAWTNIRNNGEWLFDFSYQFTATEQKNTLKVKAVYIDPPAATGTKPSVRTDYESDTTGWSYMISKNSKYPELCASVLELIGSEEYANTYYWGWEGETYQVNADGKKTFLDSYTSMKNEDVQSKYGLTIPYTTTPYVSNFYAGDAVSALWSDESKRGTKIAAEKLKSGEYENYYGRTNPDFSDEINEKKTGITTAVGTYIRETLTAFILGKKPISEWDSFLAGIKKYGDMDWVVEQYNAAPQKPLRLTATERTWLMP